MFAEILDGSVVVRITLQTRSSEGLVAIVERDVLVPADR